MVNALESTIKLMRTQRPTLRVTRWARTVQTPGPRIPFEAECTACADVQFKIKYDKRSEWGLHGLGTYRGNPPDPTERLNVLQRQFEEHVKLVHLDDDVRES